MKICKYELILNVEKFYVVIRGSVLLNTVYTLDDLCVAIPVDCYSKNI